MLDLSVKIGSVQTIVDKGGEIQVLISPKTVGSSHLIMGISRMQPGENVKKHLHNYSEESFFVVKGKGILHLEGHPPVPFESGMALFVPKGVAHSIENTGDEEMFVVFASAPLAPKPENGHLNLFKNNE